MSELRHVEVAGRRIAYRLSDGASPALMFLPGYASDMEGAKALAIDTFAGKRGLAMLRFDYSGTGSSGGSFEQGTLALWLEEALAALDQLTVGPVIVIGSSMGGWIALHLALLRPERVRGARRHRRCARFHRMGLCRWRCRDRAGPRSRLLGIRASSCCCSTSRSAIDCPVRLLHGEMDQEVPLDVAFRLMRALRSSDVQLNVLKGGGHRLSEPHEIRAILTTLDALLEPPS